MQRVYRSTRTASLPAPPAQSSSPGYFTAGDPGLGIPATVPGYEWFNGVQEELAYVITTNGLSLDRLDNTLLYQAIAAQINSRLSALDAFTYKGVIDASSNPNYPAANAGDTYKISVAGKIGGGSGPNVQVGDMIICTTDASSSGTHAGVGANWNIIQVNIDGAVVGPASATDSHFVQFDGTTGKLVKGGIALDTDNTLAADSDTRVASQKAVKAYVTASAGTAANQAEQEAATITNKYVSPGTQHMHPGSAKAWAVVTFPGGVATLAASYGISGITDHGAGDVTLTFSTAFSSAVYAPIGSGLATLAAGSEGDAIVISQLAGSCRVGHRTSQATFAGQDATMFWVFYGDQ